jgi:hypothetical protein
MTPETTEILTPAFFQNMSMDRTITVLGARFGPLAPDPLTVIPAIATLLVDGRMVEEATFPEMIIGDEVGRAIEQGAKAHVISRTSERMNIMLEGVDWDISLAVHLPPP